ncbi:GIY-YIG nuclease family protein [Nocardioides limicola]|uniref:GIY-YIG nuclease family protein n=1 Tax=Nocardioides limicola TaxID=2803368 RepID=UPI00193C032D|nr:GIY-YIG nuclease family protein [Nocardioides sp. DJM-14]
MAFTYILRCADESYYVGSTRDLQRRLWQHQQGLGSAYTKRRCPVELVWHAEFEHIGAAYTLEKQIQTWSRAKREALIRGAIDELPRLSRKKFPG